MINGLIKSTQPRVYIFSYLGLPRQAGQKSLLQTIVSSRSFIKYFLVQRQIQKFIRVILICSSGKYCQILGKLKRGKASRLAKFECTGLSWSRFPSWMSFSPIFLIALSTQPRCCILAKTVPTGIRYFPGPTYSYSTAKSQPAILFVSNLQLRHFQEILSTASLTSLRFSVIFLSFSSD